MGSRQLIPVTPAVLAWAIRESGYEDDALAAELGISLSELSAWQTGQSQPSKTEFDALVAKLKRPTAVFFLPEEPASRAPAPKFRRPQGSTRTKPNPRERRAFREANRVQEIVAWVLRELDAPIEALPLIGTTTNVETAAARVRDYLVVTERAVARPTSDAQMQNEWRGRIEARGVLAFFLPLGRDSVRGFSLSNEAAPLLAVNTHWGYRPRIFSMLHEFVHLVSRTSSACVESFHRFPDDDDRLERWCEEVAASVLMPWNEVESFLMTAVGLRAPMKVSSLEQLYKVSNNFRTSARATALRLIGKQRAEWQLYQEIPGAKEEKTGGGGGGGRTRPEIREDEYGARTIRVFAQATDRGLLTRADAAGYLKMSDVDIDAWR